jgi:hypothetical protein
MLLLVPVYVLIVVPMNMRMMATVVLGFVFLFAAALSVFTDARRLDVFIATATYSVSRNLYPSGTLFLCKGALTFRRPSWLYSWAIFSKVQDLKMIEARSHRSKFPYVREMEKNECWGNIGSG